MNPDLLPFIIQALAGGTGSGRRVTTAELPSYFASLAQFAAENSVFARSGSGPAAAIEIADNHLFGRVGGNLGPVTASQLSALLNLQDLLALKSDVSHTHAFQAGASDIDWTTLQDDRMLARIAGAFEWIDIPTGGGGGGTSGLQNPLTEDLDIAARRIMSGVQELLRFDNGVIYLGGNPLIETEFENPVAGHVPIFNESTNRFGNGYQAVSNLRGETEDKWLKVGPGGVIIEVDEPAGGGGGTGTGTGGTGGGEPGTVEASGTTFPETPTNGDAFYRTDLMATFIYRNDLPIKVTAADAGTQVGWLSLDKKSLDFYRPGPATDNSSAYIIGVGWTEGVYFPDDTVITRVHANFSTVTTGEIEYRMNVGGSLQSPAARTAPFTTGRFFDDPAMLMAPAGTFLSIYGKDFTSGVTDVVMHLEVRQFFAVS